MGYDDILREIGEFGRYQKLIFLLASLCTLLAPLNVVSQIFIAGESDHWCHVETNCSCKTTECEDWQRNITIPLSSESGVLHGQCSRYDIDTASFECFDIPERTNATIPCDDGWDYDRSQYQSTIITDFNLVCSRKNLPDVAQTIYFAGILAGSLVFGRISDKFGRRVGIFASTVSTGVNGLLVIASQSFAVYTITRFLLAASAYNTFLTTFVLVSEMVGPTKRVFTGIVIEYFFGVGVMLLPVIAYFVRQWRVLQLVITLPGFAFIPLLLVIPESPRWLMTKQRWNDALRIIKKTARINGVKLNEDALQKIRAEKNTDIQTEDCSLIQILRIPTMRIRTISLMFNWCVQSFVFYGLIFSIPSLGVNVYTAVVISGAVELIAYTGTLFVIERYGRKYSLVVLLAVVGVSCLLVIFTPGVSKFIFGMIGKAAISATFSIVYVYTAELYPTPIRAVVIGIGSMASRVATMLCPVVIILADIWAPLPITLFAATGLIAAALTLLLPETKGTPLPETMLEAINLGKKGKAYSANDLS